MLRFAGCGVVLLAVAAPSIAQDKAVKALEATYTVTSFERDGTAVPDTVKTSLTNITIAGGKLAITMNGQEIVAVLKADATRKPAEIDLYPAGPEYEKGRKFPGIFKVETATLTVAYAEDGDRPKDFAGGKGITKLVLEKK